MSILIEYIYVDEKRLGSYLEQINLPILYDKVPSFSFDLSVTGPKASGTQTRIARPLSTHEKVLELLKYLKKKKELGKGRLSDRNRWDHSLGKGSDWWKSSLVFRIETCSAQRVFLPPREDIPVASKGLSFWVSSPGTWEFSVVNGNLKHYGDEGLLYLLEDFPINDSSSFQNFSQYSCFMVIVKELRKEFDQTFLKNAFSEAYEETVAAYKQKDRIREKFRQEYEERSAADRDKAFVEYLRKNWTPPTTARKFNTDPVRVFTECGAQLGPRREITTLYRVRACLNEIDAGRTVTTYAYPIFIADGMPGNG